MVWGTRGPYTHVGIVVSTTQTIEAIQSGVTELTMPIFTQHPRGPTLVSTSLWLGNQARVARTLIWLGAQVGKGYNWVDIADSVLRVLWPGDPVAVTESGRWDCSHLATVFLALAGYPLPAAALNAPQLVSPNDLARYVGLLPLR